MQNPTSSFLIIAKIPRTKPTNRPLKIPSYRIKWTKSPILTFLYQLCICINCVFDQGRSILDRILNYYIRIKNWKN